MVIQPINAIRQAIYNVVEPPQKRASISYIYDVVMLLAIFGSLIPMMFRQYYPIFRVIDAIAVSLFCWDYALRWATADMLMPKKKRWVAFLIYPLTPFAIVDLISILPAFDVVGKTFTVLRISRVFRILRLFRYLKYSKQINIIVKVFKNEQDILLSVFGITVSYIFVVALVMFNIEDFNTFLDSMYWATITLTTIGYGDLTPVTDFGKIVAMVSSILGIAVIALPSGVIMAGYMNEVRSRRNNKNGNLKNENNSNCSNDRNL